jgi:hypothetical protein
MRVGNRDLGAFFQEASRNRMADTGSGAGSYQCNFVL